MVVLILAASGGLVAAWLVASMNAVPGPIAAVTPSPAPDASAGPNESPTPGSSDQPRHTPTPSPQVTQEPAPFTYVVQRGDSVTWIAQMFQVEWEDIVALNDLKPPKYRIFPDQELLIPGYGIPPATPTPKPGKTAKP
jgi:LysM repeat protein